MTFKSSLLAILSFSLTNTYAIAEDGAICKTDKTESTAKSNCKGSENLGFSFIDLRNLLDRKFHSRLMLPHKESPEAFECRVEEIEVSGWRSLADGNVVYITVRGKGKAFVNCVCEIVRLCNHHKPKNAHSILERLTNSLQKQSRLDVLFQSDDLRYSLQELSGASVFHCTNARQQDKGLLKVQPG